MCVDRGILNRLRHNDSPATTVDVVRIGFDAHAVCRLLSGHDDNESCTHTPRIEHSIWASVAIRFGPQNCWKVVSDQSMLRSGPGQGGSSAFSLVIFRGCVFVPVEMRRRRTTPAWDSR
jgi:hypothetical protein